MFSTPVPRPRVPTRPAADRPFGRGAALATAGLLVSLAVVSSAAQPVSPTASSPPAAADVADAGSDVLEPDAESPEAGETSDGSLADAEPPNVPPAPLLPPAAEVAERLERARTRITALRRLLLGTLPEAVGLRDLFDYDITDPEAVEARKEALVRVVTARRQGLLDAGAADAGAAPPAPSDAGVLLPDIPFPVPPMPGIVPEPPAPLPGAPPLPEPLASATTVADAGTDSPASADVGIDGATGAAADVDPDAAEDAGATVVPAVPGPPLPPPPFPAVPAEDGAPAGAVVAVPAAPADPDVPRATASQVVELIEAEREAAEVELAFLDTPPATRARLARQQAQRDRIAAELAAAAAVAEDDLRARVEDTRRRTAAIRMLIVGTLPENLSTAQLFSVDVADEPAVARRRVELQSEANARRSQLDLQAAAPPVPAPETPEEEAAAAKRALVRELAEAELGLAEARLAFLSRSATHRHGVLAAEQEQRRLMLERQEAAAEQERAARETEAAEAARRAARDAERTARTAFERSLAHELAEIEEARLAQAQRRAALADRRADDVQAEQERTARTYDVFDALRTPPLAADRANALFDRVNAEYDAAVGAVVRAFEARGALAPAPRYDPEPGFLDGLPPAFSDRKAEIMLRREELAEAAEALERDEREAAERLLSQAMGWQRRLFAARRELLPRLSAGRRDEALGLGRDGFEQMGREWRRLGIEARWYVRHRPGALGRAIAALGDPFTLGETALRLLALLGLVGGVFWLRRRGPAWIEKLSVAADRGLRGRPWTAGKVQALLAAIEAVWAPGLLVAAVLIAPAALGPSAAAVPEVALILALLGWFAGYALAVATAERLIAWAARRYGEGLRREVRRKLRASLILIGRYVLVAAMVLLVAETLVARGAIHDNLGFLAGLGGWIVAFLLLRRWQPDIADRYVVYRPTGRLADRVRATRDKRYGFLVAMVAFALVAAVGTWRVAKRFVLGFEQTRKALAYLFRRRLEKRMGESALRPTDVVLPDDLAEALRGSPVDPERGATRAFPELDVARDAIATWRTGSAVGALLLVGRPGIGRTSWIRAAERLLEGIPIDRMTVDRRVLDPAGIIDRIGATLGAPPEARRDVDALAAWLASGPPRAVIWDDLERLVLRGVGTLGAWDALRRLVERTGDRVFWLATMARYPYEYLAWAGRGTDVFRDRVELGPWSEEDIAALIRGRMEAAGYEVAYDDLLLERMDGVEGNAQTVNTARQYLRLVWDYADGCPRVALHFWAASLMPDGEKRVRVRLFQRPDPDRLEALVEHDKFLLASIVWHGELTPEHAARSLRFPETRCRDGLARMREDGILEEHEGRLRVTTEWLAAVLRYLNRKHLIDP